MCDHETIGRKLLRAAVVDVSWRLSRESVKAAVRPGCPYSVAHEIVTVIDEAPEGENARRSRERRKWFAEGRCPRCGELGAMKACAPVCSVHGPYEFVAPAEPVQDPDVTHAPSPGWCGGLD